MTNLKNKIDNAKDKIAGEVKETTGKITGNQQLELKGKIQSSKADLKKKMSLGNKIEAIKEDIAENINDKIDKKKH